jgi:hypothetical protein
MAQARYFAKDREQCEAGSGDCLVAVLFDELRETEGNPVTGPILRGEIWETPRSEYSGKTRGNTGTSKKENPVEWLVCISARYCHGGPGGNKGRPGGKRTSAAFEH